MVVTEPVVAVISNVYGPVPSVAAIVLPSASYVILVIFGASVTEYASNSL